MSLSDAGGLDVAFSHCAVLDGWETPIDDPFPRFLKPIRRPAIGWIKQTTVSCAAPVLMCTSKGVRRRGASNGRLFPDQRASALQNVVRGFEECVGHGDLVHLGLEAFDLLSPSLPSEPRPTPSAPGRALALFFEDRSSGLAWASLSPAAWERAGAAVLSVTPGSNRFLGPTLSLRLSDRGRSRLSRRTARRPKDTHGAAVWVAGVSWPDSFLTAGRHAQAAG